MAFMKTGLNDVICNSIIAKSEEKKLDNNVINENQEREKKANI